MTRRLLLGFIYACLYSASVSGFEIADRYPPVEGAVHYVKEGERLKLSCTSSEEFNLCRWVQPGSPSPCIIFGEMDEHECGKTSSKARWRVQREAGNVCSVTIDEVNVQEEGTWHCHMQSAPTERSRYEKAKAYTEVRLVDEAVVELTGPREIVVFEGELMDFNCKAKGNPLPDALVWTIQRQPIEGMEVVTSEVNDGSIEESVQAIVKRNWNGKTLNCIAVQTDGEGNEIERSDSRTLKVEHPRTAAQQKDAPIVKSGEFVINDRYPEGDPGNKPKILMSPNEPITFQCTSSIPWNVCRWKRPNSQEPCGILDDDQRKPCDKPEVWGSVEGGRGWTAEKSSDYTCTLSTQSLSDADAGDWHCELISKFSTPQGDYDRDEAYFTLETIQKAELITDWPKEVDLMEGEEVELEIEVVNAYPLPELIWKLNSREFKPELVDETKPAKDGQGRYSFSQTVRYKADFEDAGNKLICTSRQIDDEDNQVEESEEVFLAIKAEPPPPVKKSMTPAIISIIVVICVLILLVVILLIYAYKKKRWCFSEPPEVKTIYLEEDPKETGEMEIQTDVLATQSAGAGVDFGPKKPDRYYGAPPDVTARLIAGEEDDKDRFAKDEKTDYGYEGSGSRAGSLESLKADPTKKDWKETLQTLPPEFAEMAEFMRERAAPDDSADDDNAKGGSQV